MLVRSIDSLSSMIFRAFSIVHTRSQQTRHKTGETKPRTLTASLFSNHSLFYWVLEAPHTNHLLPMLQSTYSQSPIEAARALPILLKYKAGILGRIHPAMMNLHLNIHNTKFKADSPPLPFSFSQLLLVLGVD